MVAPEIAVDTSVVFKWFVAYGENGLNEAAELLQRQRSGAISLIAPSHITVEIANTLRYVTPSPSDAISYLEDFEAVGIRLFDTTPSLVRLAIKRASQTGMGVYDALFLALAEERGCPLVSADRKAFAGIESAIEVHLI